MHEIVDNCADLGSFKCLALNLGANRVQAWRGGSRGNCNVGACRLSKAPKRRLRHAKLVGPDQAVIIGEKHRRQLRLRAAAQLDPGKASKQVRPERR
ncbi:hypothetical protein ABIG05_007736 [Bradyrhizobium japonicum]